MSVHLAAYGQGVEDELQMDEAEEAHTQQERNEQEAGRLAKRGEFACSGLLSLFTLIISASLN